MNESPTFRFAVYLLSKPTRTVAVAAGVTARKRDGAVGEVHAAFEQLASWAKSETEPRESRDGVKNIAIAGRPVWSPAADVSVRIPDEEGPTPLHEGTSWPQTNV